MSSEWLAPPDFQAIARHSRSRYRTAFSAATVPSSLPRSDATSHALTAALASPPGLLLLLSLGLWPPPLRAPPGIPRGRARDAHAPCDAAPSGRDRAGSRAEVVARGAPTGRALPASPAAAAGKRMRPGTPRLQKATGQGRGRKWRLSRLNAPGILHGTHELWDAARPRRDRAQLRAEVVAPGPAPLPLRAVAATDAAKVLHCPPPFCQLRPEA